MRYRRVLLLESPLTPALSRRERESAAWQFCVTCHRSCVGENGRPVLNGEIAMPSSVKVLSLLVLAISLTGCATFKDQAHAKYELGTPAKLREVPAGGLYQVQWM